MNKYEVTLAVMSGKVKHVVWADNIDEAAAEARRAHKGVVVVTGCKALVINGRGVE